MKEKNLAAGVDRDIVMECEKLGMDISEFYGICLKTIQDIADEPGL